MLRLHTIWCIGCMLMSFMQIHIAVAASANHPAIQQAETLIQANDFEGAYQVLLPLEKQYAGHLEFDLLLGNAAVESGHYTQGMFALERVLVIDPNHQVARAKIAKAHFFLGEVATSKTEFNYLLNQNPSAETAKAIEKYLSAIDKAMGISTTYHGFLEAGLGWDSNVNSATGANTISVPVFGGLNFTLADEAQKKSDTFLNVAGGAGFRIPTSEQVALIGNVQFAKRINQTFQAFETAAIDLNLGVQIKQNDNSYTLALQDGHFYVDDETFRHAYGATAQWQRNIDAQNQASVYGQYSKLEYEDSPIRDANRYVLGLNYAHAFEASTNPVVFLGAYIAQEDTVRSNARFLDQDIYGVRAGGQLVVAPSWLAYVSAGYESRDHKAEDLAFLRKRKDEQYDITLGVNYMPARYWTVKPQISLIKNESNIELNAFERATMSIQIRRDFDW
jgi:tetratricopeptide (TPR) repeat protein